MTNAPTDKTTDKNSLAPIFENLWRDYVALNPQALKIHDLIRDQEAKAGRKLSRLENDHVAFRTFNHPRIGLNVFAALFEKHGYERKGEYKFKEKKLYAVHLQHPDKSQPKIFISELLLEKFDGAFDAMAEKIAQSVPADLLTSEKLLWSGRSWQPSFAEFEAYSKISEYAAWVYAFGFRTNHFTLSLNESKAFADLTALNTFLKAQGFALNASGGEIKGSKDVYLEQSSTLSEKIDVTFAEKTLKIPSCYYEFALRHIDPSGELYQGFVSDSADKIFESTYRTQGKRT
jgi:hypothetical protein